ncbi:cytochrome c oxidase copper chaperone [Cotesia glomerata]|uniref:Cytochrome c oxidase copper chaperone n=1 Tax=Cotesia glomerata TaxID=32391 RepID=A0AAV7I8J8_COTGL|nr:cytochrome c oxidase copper chaperone [Cotesia glomerata]KAH0547040.1 Cytochrome c oxidase copper chaperone [Cotesia glomerata]
MGNSAAKTEVNVTEVSDKPKDDKKLKPCCACPETKQIRDKCIIEKGESECGHLIEAHKACMRYYGFNI